MYSNASSVLLQHEVVTVHHVWNEKQIVNPTDSEQPESEQINDTKLRLAQIETVSAKES